MKKTLHTKYGNAKISNKGYYVITSKKEGNNMKLLHRLIAKDYFGDWIDEPLINGEQIDIHHIDGNPLNNCVLNLLPLPKSEHHKLHNSGENHPNYGKHLSDETKRKISESHKGKTLSDEHKKNLSESHKGKTLSDETKKKLSESHKGKTLSDEHKKNLSESHKGKTLSDETKKKLSESKKGIPKSEEHKQKLSEAMKGKTHSEKSKYKMSESKNSTGYFRVTTKKDKTCKQGFIYDYQYYDENGKRKHIVSVDIEKLKEKVKAKGLEWREI